MDIQDYWKHVADQPDYQKMSDDDKQAVKTQLFQNVMGNNPSYFNADFMTRKYMRDQFMHQLTYEAPKPPSGFFQTAKRAAEVLPAVVSLTPQFQASKEALKGLGKAEQLTPIKSLQKLSQDVSRGTEDLQQKIEPTEEELGKEYQKTEGISGKSAAEMSASFLLGTAGGIVKTVIPTNWTDVALMVGPSVWSKAKGIATLLPSTVEMEGLKEVPEVKKGNDLLNSIAHDNWNMDYVPQRTALPPGKMVLPQTTASSVLAGPERPLSQLLNQEEQTKLDSWLKDSLPTSRIPWNEEQRVSIQRVKDTLKRNIDQFKAGGASTAEKPLSQLRQTEETMPLNQWLENTDPMNPSNHLESLTQDAYSNLSQMRDAVKSRIERLQAEPHHLFRLATQENAIHLTPEEAESLKNKSILQVIRDLNRYMGQRGSIGFEDLNEDQKKWLYANIHELTVRARSMGLQSANEILDFAIKSGVASGDLNSIRTAATALNLNPMDKTMTTVSENARQGNPQAQEYFKQSSWQDYNDWKNGKISLQQLIHIDKVGDEMKGHLKTRYFLHDYVSAMTPEEKEATTFLIEGKTPKEENFSYWPNYRKILDLAKNPTAIMKKALPAIKVYTDAVWNDLVRHYDDIGYVINYAFHQWEDPKTYVNWIRKNLGYSNPFTRQRTFATRAEGIDSGFRPKEGTLSVENWIKTMDNMRITSLSKARVIRNLENTPVEGNLMAVSSDKDAPLTWIRSNHPLMKGRAIAPEYANVLDMLFSPQPDFTGLTGRMVDASNSLVKAWTFFGSAFHPVMLNTLYAGSLRWEHPLEAMSDFAKVYRYAWKGALASVDRSTWSEKNVFGKIRSLMKSFDEGNALLANRPLAMDAAEHGVKFGVVDDTGFDFLTRKLRQFESSLPEGIRKTAVGMARKATDLYKKSVWDYMATSIKMSAFENDRAWMRKSFPTLPEKVVDMTVGSYINKNFGGLTLADLMATPRFWRTLHTFFLAPDWMITEGLRLSPILKGDSPQSRKALRSLIQLGTSYYTLGNILNHHNTERVYGPGKGRWMWQNAPGRAAFIFKGIDPKTGEEQYYNLMPFYTDLYRFAEHPYQFLTNRSSPAVRAATVLLTGHEPGGFPVKSVGQFLKENVTPLQLREFPSFGSTLRGMNRYDTEKMYLKYYQTGDRRYADIASEFGVNQNQEDRRARQEYRREERKGLLQ